MEHIDPRNAAMGKQIYNILTGAGFDIDMFDSRGNITQSSEEATRFWSDELKIMVVIGGKTGGSNPKSLVTFNISDVTIQDPDLFLRFKDARHLIIKGNKEDFSFRLYRFGRTLTKRSFKNLNIQESWTGSTRTSRQPIDSVIIVIRHTKPWNRDNLERAQRWRRIRSIMLHLPDGQRLQFPHHHLRGARAMAQHLNQGCEMHDENGKMIQSLTKLSMDLRSVQRKCSRANKFELKNNIRNSREQIHVLLDCISDSALYENSLEDAVEWCHNWKYGNSNENIAREPATTLLAVEPQQDFKESRELQRWLGNFSIVLNEEGDYATDITKDDIEQVKTAMKLAKASDGDKHTAFNILKNDTDSGWDSLFDEDPKAATEKFEKILKHLRLNENSEDSNHFSALEKTGFFGKKGAGCIFVAEDTGRFLLAHRSQYVEQPGTWGGFGGAINSKEEPEEAVRREVKEETGYSGDFEIEPLFVFEKDSFKYYNFLAVVEHEFKPVLDWENQGYQWCDFGEWPEPLHFGLVSLFNDSSSREKMEKYSK